ncbi:MAG: hypothetical protein EOP22_19620 [Hyphomicrobiales bacterium]|nr:MAG: hypothetical protein EOP22_19620 [Hyphomicrobiales bacterium]
MAELYSRREGDRIVIHLDPGQPVELGDLSESFAALARIYDRHYRNDGEGAPKLFVTKLETGSILLEIAPFAVLMGVISFMDGSVIVAEFTNRLWRGIKSFASPSDLPHIQPPSLEDAHDIREFTKPLLGRKAADLGIKHARYEKIDGEKRTMVEYHFDEAELNRAAINIEKALEVEQRAIAQELAPSEQLRREVMLFLDQANRGPGKEAGRTGDKGVIPEITDKPLPVYFKKSVQSLKDQMTRDVNPLTSAFVVDVLVLMVEAEPRGYSVVAVHNAMPGDGEAD